MVNKRYDIYRSSGPIFEAALDELLAQISKSERQTLRIIIFGEPQSDEEFANQRSLAESRCRELFGDRAPMIAYIAQAPLCCQLAAEVTSLADGVQADAEYHHDYILLDGKEVISGGIYSNPNDGIAKQAEAIFERMSEIISAEKLQINDIVRQWNYIEQITLMSAEGQHYQLFNDARSRFYNRCEWPNGYPAATGIGAQRGGVTVLFDAVRDSSLISKAVDNPLQISAHAYSQQVLINNTDAHKTTPKFERARYIGGEQPTVYISGTAAIRGEESCKEDVVRQTALTMENIGHLVGVQNLAKSGVERPSTMHYATMRAYLKHRFDFEASRRWIDENYPTMPTLYLWADICRDELLIEIEGIAAQSTL